MNHDGVSFQNMSGSSLLYLVNAAGYLLPVECQQISELILPQIPFKHVPAKITQIYQRNEAFDVMQQRLEN